MSVSVSTLSTQALYSSALNAASKAYSLPSINDETQEIVNSAINDLKELTSRIYALHLFSENESIEDVSTRHLLYMTVPFVFAEVILSTRTSLPDERKLRLRQAKELIRSFVTLLDEYSIVTSDDKKVWGQKASGIADPAKRREVKITQFKKEKEMKQKIKALRLRRGLPEIDSSNNYELVQSLLPGHSAPTDDDDDDDEYEQVTREVSLVLIRLFWAQAMGHLDSIDLELELLLNAPPAEEQRGPGPSVEDDDTWRLDIPSSPFNPQEPLLDASGRPLRPFTILPGGSIERARLQAEVFHPDHRLPTMTIDEYLAEERRRGNIISGGGPQSAAGPTSKEQLAMDAEMEGTQEGEKKSEQKRAEDERWALFTEANPRGSGNRMNRG